MTRHDDPGSSQDQPRDAGLGAWSEADDERIRIALMALRDDVDGLPLAEPGFIRARSGARRRRRPLVWIAAAAAAAVAAAIGLSQLERPRAADPAGSPTTQATAPTE
ncbi:MAG: hypothetical protein Q4G67_10095, partial [Actinomycetia bacterium]|nr:hypothetical protein [Actinomycetes bacterium]